MKLKTTAFTCSKLPLNWLNSRFRNSQYSLKYRIMSVNKLALSCVFIYKTPTKWGYFPGYFQDYEKFLEAKNTYILWKYSHNQIHADQIMKPENCRNVTNSQKKKSRETKGDNSKLSSLLVEVQNLQISSHDPSLTLPPFCWQKL